MGLVHYFQNIDFFRLFKYGGRVGKEIVKFCHPLQVANFSMLLVQNCLRYVNIMTFETVHDTLPKNHFAEKTFRRNDTMPKILLRCDTSPKISND